MFRIGVSSLSFPYENGDQEYRALRHRLDRAGPADLCFLGSSRGREVVVMPEVTGLLEEGGYDGIRVENYSLSSALAVEANSIIELITRSERRPRLLVYGVSPPQLLNAGDYFRNASRLWDVRAILRHHEMNDAGVLSYLPRAIRNDISKVSETFHWRPRKGLRPLLRHLFRELSGRNDTRQSPITGGLTLWQHEDPDRGFAPTPDGLARNNAFLAEAYKGGRDWIDPTQSRYFEDSLQLSQEAGIPVILVEMPLTSALSSGYPEGVYRDYMSFMRAVADRYGATFVTLEDLGFQPQDSQFRDTEHLNLGASLEFTRSLTRQVLLPRLDGELRR